MTKFRIVKKGERRNASQYPKFYYTRHMYPGLCGYDGEVLLIDTDVMKGMAKSFNGKPVYVLHDERGPEERLDTLQETSHGYVTETFYNEVDGWLWSKIMIVDDEGHKAIAKGWAVSNAYIPLQYGPGGTKHNCEYDQKVLDAEFTHLAIVPNPRYEDACVMTPDEFKLYQEKEREQLNELQNSKTEKKGFTMKFFNKTKVKGSEVNENTIVEIQNSKGETVEVPVSEMVNALLDSQKEKQNMAKKIKVGDKEMTLKELVNAYSELANKADEDEKENEDERDNEDDEERENMEDDELENEDDEYENEDDDEKENMDDEKSEKSNASKKRKAKDHFKEMKNANKKRTTMQTFDTPQNKLDRGKSRYGTVN